MNAGIHWDFETYPEYLAAVARHGTALNYTGYVGHTPLRLYVMGEDAFERTATDDELARMRQIVSDAVRAGGTWSVTAAFLSDGPHRVVMSVSDAAGNLASFTQTLTVDTVPPVVAITGGATATTGDVDPTIVEGPLEL